MRVASTVVKTDPLFYPPVDEEPIVAFGKVKRKPSPKMTARQVLDGLRARHKPAEWAFIEEVRARTGWVSAGSPGYGRMRDRGESTIEQRIDAFALQFWSPFRIIAYEVKVSRADFFHEVKDQSKRMFAASVSSEFWFATPPNLVSLSEVPDNCGLVEVHPHGLVRAVRSATVREVKDPPWRFVGSLLRMQRRDAYAMARGLPGQCTNRESYRNEPVKHEWGSYMNLVPYAFGDAQWCVKEEGHAGWCRLTDQGETDGGQPDEARETGSDGEPDGISAGG